ncbi:hypothetical protein IKF23_03390 [Candidatus Saccharibacteria bacterium]|nr:hypothetical protein [Candidatus Saccharibacteria bacterium]
MQKNNESHPGKLYNEAVQTEQHTTWDDLKNTPSPAQKIESNLEDDLANIQDMLEHGKISKEQADKYAKEAQDKAESAKLSNLDSDTKKALEDDLANIQDMLEHGKISEEQADKYTKEVQDKAFELAHHKTKSQQQPMPPEPTSSVESAPLPKPSSPTVSSPISTPKPSASSVFKKFTNPYRPHNPEEARLDAMLEDVIKKDKIPREQKAQFQSEADMDAVIGQPQAITLEPMPESTSKQAPQNIIKDRDDKTGQTQEQNLRSQKQQELELQKQQELELQKQQELELQKQQELESQKQEEPNLEEVSHKMEDWLEDLDSFGNKIEAETEKLIAEQAEKQKTDLYKIRYEINQIDQELSKLDEADLDLEESLSEPSSESSKSETEIDKNHESSEQPSSPKKRIIKKRIIKRIVKKPQTIEEPQEVKESQELPKSPEEPSEPVFEAPNLESAGKELTDAEVDQLNTNLMTEIIDHADLIGGARGVAYVMSNQLLDDNSTNEWDKWWDDLSEEAKKYVNSVSDKINSLDSKIRFQIPWGWGFRSWLTSKIHNAKVKAEQNN